MNKTFAILLFSLVTLASCKTSKNTAGTPAIKAERMAPQALLDSLNKRHVDFEWLTFKAKVDYWGEKRSENFTANIRMRKDSVIWVSVTSLMGVEVARLLITKDSVEILDRLKKQHTKKPITSLEQYVPFPITIRFLQDVLAGNYLLDTVGELKSGVEKDRHKLLVNSDNFNSEYLIDPATFRLGDMEMKEKQGDRQLNVTLKDYSEQNGHEFSNDRTLIFKAKKSKVKMHMRCSRVTWNEPCTFPFYVSDKYD